MKNRPNTRSGLTSALLLAFAAGSLLATTSQAADGSGYATAAPNTVQSSSTGNNLTLQFTATEDMGDGTVRMSVPNGFPNPTANNTTVTVTDGVSADILDDLEEVPIMTGMPGWNADDGLPLVDLLSLSQDSGEFYEGSHSLEVNFLANLGLFTPSVWYNFDAPQNWAGYTRLSFRIKLSTLLAAAIDLGDGEIRISENSDLANATVYDLSNALIEVTLLEGGEWAQVVVDLSTAPMASRDAVLSYGIKFPALTLGVATSLNLDYFLLGPGSPIFSGSTATQHLISLNDGGTVTFQYHGITAPAQTGTYSTNFSSRTDSGGDLKPIGDSPEITVVDVNSQNCVSMDADGDSGQEFACDTNNDGCYGDAYFDPDGSSNACLTLDGDNDGCPDFFIDVDGSGCAMECPDTYWDPTREVTDDIHERGLDVDGDGGEDAVCAYDSDGDGNDDSYVLANQDNPNDGNIGGSGAGLPNPFFEGGGCSLRAGTPQLRMNSAAIIAILASIGAMGAWRARKIRMNS